MAEGRIFLRPSGMEFDSLPIDARCGRVRQMDRRDRLSIARIEPNCMGAIRDGIM